MSVSHDGINRGKGCPTDTLIVVVFGRVGGERGSPERNPGADSGEGGGQLGKREAVGDRQKDQAINYAQNRACFRSGEIRILDLSGNVERTIPFSEADRRL